MAQGSPCHACSWEGLLTDEVWSQLLIRHWDKRLSRDILAHWLDLLSEDGWIAREQVSTPATNAQMQAPVSCGLRVCNLTELHPDSAVICTMAEAALRIQILGEEARARVPANFLAQSPDVANPPTLFLPLADMAQRLAKAGTQLDEDGQEELVFLKAGALHSEFHVSLRLGMLSS